ncbi:hypothetical protein CKAH01_01430 [Colletotrichum kahawae]|uniref:Uncharacterized protein n=1 Tax=Colletotrichum kahawae TaxID=34407 RepID=A0AAD9Y836_COLKA|nr:hypothetical protein CKAH01_01430 [Colletotrichum kahawae]
MQVYSSASHHNTWPKTATSSATLMLAINKTPAIVEGYVKRVRPASCSSTSKSRKTRPSHVVSRSSSMLCSPATQSNVRRMPAHTPPSRAPSFFKVATDVDVTASLATPGSLPTIPGPFPRRPSGGQCALPPLLDRPPLTHHHMASLFDTSRFSGSDVSSVLCCHKALIELALTDLPGDISSPVRPSGILFVISRVSTLNSALDRILSTRCFRTPLLGFDQAMLLLSSSIHSVRLFVGLSSALIVANPTDDSTQHRKHRKSPALTTTDQSSRVA